jgi:hypothetical protein
MMVTPAANYETALPICQLPLHFYKARANLLSKWKGSACQFRVLIYPRERLIFSS